MKVIIWGAGQGGRMVGNLLHGDMTVVAYCDRDEKKWGRTLGGVPIVPPAELQALKPDLIFISMLNKDACAAVTAQLRELSPGARIMTAVELRELFDLRLATLKLLAQEVRDRDIPGAVAELGVYQGAFAAEMNRLFPERPLYLFDTFTGFDQRDVSVEQQQGFSRAVTGNFNDTTVDRVRRRLPHPEKAVFREGYFPETAQGIRENFAVVSLDADLYQPLYDGLVFFYPLLSQGGCLIIHDYNNARFSGAKHAVRKFCDEQHVFVVPVCDLHGTAVILKP